MAHWRFILFPGEPMPTIPMVELVVTPKSGGRSLGGLRQPHSTLALLYGQEIETTKCFFAFILYGFPRLPDLSMTFAACTKRNGLLEHLCKLLFCLKQPELTSAVWRVRNLKHGYPTWTHWPALGHFSWTVTIMGARKNKAISQICLPRPSLPQYAMLPVSLVMKMCSSVKGKAAPLS